MDPDFNSRLSSVFPTDAIRVVQNARHTQQYDELEESFSNHLLVYADCFFSECGRTRWLILIRIDDEALISTQIVFHWHLTVYTSYQPGAMPPLLQASLTIDFQG